MCVHDVEVIQNQTEKSTPKSIKFPAKQKDNVAR